MNQISTPEALKLFHDGSLALAEVEHAGIKIDVEYLDKTIIRVGNKIKRLETELRHDKVFYTWRREYGAKTNLGSREQLAHVLFDCMKIPYTYELTKSERYRTDKDVFETIDLPFVKTYNNFQKLSQLRGTFLRGIKSEVVDGFIHPFFNLHTVSTMRSSSDSPNWQNQPIRDPVSGKYIRRAIVPREGNILIEVDFGALEFRIASCKWEDERMLEYASDPTKDIHRDMAAAIFACKKNQVSKQMRYLGKNGFVFPILYGSWYLKCAQAIWLALDGLLMADGVTLVKDWLKSKGITKLGACDPKIKPVPGTFEHQVKKIEDKFKADFPDWAKGVEKWIADYKKNGGFRMMTGFWIGNGSTNTVLSVNQLLNYDVQGPAFHILLMALILALREIKQKKMKSLIVAEIHDSIIADVPINEKDQFLHMIKRIMTVDVPKLWKWIIVPLEVEMTISEKSWYEKVPVKI